MAFAQVSGDAAPPPCGESYRLLFQRWRLPTSPIAVCACSCSDPSGETCPMPTVTYFSDPTCMSPCGTPTPFSTAACTTPDCESFIISEPALEGGTCVPEAGVSLPELTWSFRSVECSPVTPAQHGSCRAAELCLPAPPPAFAFCISKSGTASACPPGAYSQGPFVEYPSDTTDTRGCTPCRCDPPSGGSCSQPSGFVSDKNCSVPAGFSPVANHCYTSVGAKAYSELTVMDAGACKPKGGVAQGSVSPAGAPTSVCCAL